jgi:hypothetical protein
MVAAEIVDYDDSTKKYSLPEDHAFYLTSKAEGGVSTSAMTQPLICQSYVDIIKCFQKDGPKGI